MHCCVVFGICRTEWDAVVVSFASRSAIIRSGVPSLRHGENSNGYFFPVQRYRFQALLFQMSNQSTVTVAPGLSRHREVGSIARSDGFPLTRGPAHTKFVFSLQIPGLQVIIA